MMIPDEVIQAATHGESFAQSFILDFYDDYICSIATVMSISDDGLKRFHIVDQDIKIQIQSKLLESIKRFE